MEKDKVTNEVDKTEEATVAPPEISLSPSAPPSIGIISDLIVPAELSRDLALEVGVTTKKIQFGPNGWNPPMPYQWRISNGQVCWELKDLTVLLIKGANAILGILSNTCKSGGMKSSAPITFFCDFYPNTSETARLFKWTPTDEWHVTCNQSWHPFSTKYEKVIPPNSNTPVDVALFDHIYMVRFRASSPSGIPCPGT